jgi:hypothetical protein
VDGWIDGMIIGARTRLDVQFIVLGMSNLAAMLKSRQNKTFVVL